MASYVIHLESAIDGTLLDHKVPQSLHKDRPLWVRYDLDEIRSVVTPAMIATRGPSIWRYRELLPVSEEGDIVSLGEGMSPLLAAPRLGRMLGLEDLWIKDESQLPTGSFKARGQAVAISMCKQFGIKRVAIPTAGNAGGAMAHYAARAGMEAFIFMPADTPLINQIEAVMAGAKVYLVDGMINDCGRIVREGKQAMEWFDLSTLKEPYRIEGKKTMGLELAEQFGWSLPDVILYPTGGGTGLIGMWKAFAELVELGWLKSNKLPRMVSVQSDGCAPIVRAFEKGERFAPLFENAHTVASGIRVPVAVGDFMILDAVRESGGTCIAVPDGELVDWMNRATAAEGISICPESAAAIVAAGMLRGSGWIQPKEKVVIFNCAAGQKYPQLSKLELPRIKDAAKVNFEEMMS